jgi:hypothetical protein
LSGLKKRIEYDKLKRDLCKKNGVRLIDIPDIFNILGLDNVNLHLLKEFKRLKLRPTVSLSKIKINFKLVYNPDKISRYNQIAKKKGGRCISKVFLGTNVHLDWECADGHEWKAKPSNIMSGTWCPFCANKRQTIDEYNNIANNKGGRCLSKEYKGSTVKLKWECNKKHSWMAHPSSLKQGSWCPDCAQNKLLSISEAQNIAVKNGGKCLSKKYLNSREHLKWQCAKGHRWLAALSHVKGSKGRKGSWCPKCSHSNPYSISDMKSIAKKKRGTFLSKTYTSVRKLHKWKCHKKHTWSATPANVIKGTWCPKCSAESRGKNMRLGIDLFIKIAKERGGKCLSKTYINNRTHLKFKCAKGHEWPANPDNIKRGQWCPRCKNRKLNEK